MQNTKWHIILLLVCVNAFATLCFSQNQKQNSALIEQVGSNNRSVQNQIGKNGAEIIQQNVYASVGDQKQVGNNNSAAILQKNYNRNKAFQRQHGWGNRAAVVQEKGGGNYAFQRQAGVSNKGGGGTLSDPVSGYSHNPVRYGAFIEQKGILCRAIQRQVGHNNYNFILQEGSGQRAEVNQYGSGFSHVLIQEASYRGPKYKITQIGVGGGFPRPTIIVHQK